MPTRTKKKTSPAVAMKNEEILREVASETPNSVVNKVAELGTTVADELGQLIAKLTEQFGRVTTLDTAIQLKRDELERLHQVQATVEAAYALEEEVTTGREHWEREQAQRELRWAEEDADREKELKRQEDEYDYTFEVQKKKRQQQLEDELGAKQRSFLTDVETRNKQLNERQAAINAQEQEINVLKQRAASFDNEVKKVADREIARVSHEMKRDHETQVAILKTQTERDLALAQQRVEAAEGQVQDLVDQINSLKAQLNKTQNDIKEISTAAFDSVSGRAALAAVKDVTKTETPAPSGRGR
jgi:chromosome segregation ATPase